MLYYKCVMMSLWVPDGSYGQHEHIYHIWSAWYLIFSVHACFFSSYGHANTSYVPIRKRVCSELSQPCIYSRDRGFNTPDPSHHYATWDHKISNGDTETHGCTQHQTWLPAASTAHTPTSTAKHCARNGTSKRSAVALTAAVPTKVARGGFRTSRGCF